MKLGDKLQKMRQERGMSQDLLSLELNVSKTALRKWEQNEAKPSIENLLRICDYFETDIYSLLENVSNLDFSHSKFEGTNYVVAPKDTTINFNDNKEIFEIIMSNQEKINTLMQQQFNLFQELLPQKK